MYVYRLSHERASGFDKLIGYYSSWKKARKVMRFYQSNVEGFKDYPSCFIIKKIRINKDDFYFK